ncbi:MAG: helix-turn-helix transcriptional regulator, partial [Haloarculaceae archaeon]
MGNIDGLDRTVSGRREFLAELIDEPLSKPALVDRLDVSRSTVDRAITELEELGLVSQTDSEYRATQPGKCVYRAYRDYLDQIRDVSRAEDVLDDLPPEADVDPRVLAGAEILRSGPFAPGEPVEDIVERVTSARRLRGAGPVVLPGYVDAVRDAVREDGLAVDLVITPWAGDAFDGDYSRDYGTLTATDGVHLHESNRSVPYGLWIVD